MMFGMYANTFKTSRSSPAELLLSIMCATLRDMNHLTCPQPQRFEMVHLNYNLGLFMHHRSVAAGVFLLLPPEMSILSTDTRARR